MSNDPTYIVCGNCGGSRFMQARRIYTIPLQDGTPQRNWASVENDRDEIVCSGCQIRLRWDSKLGQYVPFVAS